MDKDLITVDNDKLRLFEAEMKPHLDSLYNFAYHLTYSADDADDLVQDAYEKAFRSLDGYQSGSNAKAWLFRILKNTFINNYRKVSKKPLHTDYDTVVADHDSDELGYKDMAGIVNDEVFDRMMGDEVTSAINSLQPVFKEILLLSDVEDLTYDEISAVLDIPIGTVRSRLFRARNLMKEKLCEYAKANGFKDKRSK